MIDIRLKVFYTVARNLSFSKASHILYISQPAVSKHIAELEREFATRLFDRLGNKIQLTTSGELLLTHTEQIIKDYERMTFEMNRLQHKTSGELRVGASTTISQYILPEILASFLLAYPEVHIDMLSGNSNEIEDYLKAGRIDIGLVEGIARQPGLKYSKFMKDELVAIVSNRHPLATCDEISIDELKTQPLVMREFGSGSLDVIEQRLLEQDVRLSDLNILLNFGTTEGIKNFVSDFDVMGIVSVRAVNKEILAGQFKIIDIKGLPINRYLNIVEKQGEATGVQALFRQHITKSYNI